MKRREKDRRTERENERESAEVELTWTGKAGTGEEKTDEQRERERERTSAEAKLTWRSICFKVQLESTTRLRVECEDSCTRCFIHLTTEVLRRLTACGGCDRSRELQY